ncbi:hypothetical protein HPB50_020834 [Hyalomma asiaticum]|uniref:Uncharacterized protein n=1 Tax=Hyalomma asiaticum TaxID=266040 RepID=A0ACB7RVV4_HYAAI|nr:hypothetical protein HPB50_020834 [Hyalomma asiaticum]
MFYSMNDQQMVGMAPEKENLYSNSYLNTSLQPFVQPFGVNTDVLLMNLTRMRAFGFERRLGILQEDIENVTLSRFQDAMNILFAKYPQGIFTFTCRWNYRVDHCSSTALCTDLPVAVVHGGVFMYTNGAFMALHTSMKEQTMRPFVPPKSLVCLCLALIAALFVITKAPRLEVCFGPNCYENDAAQRRRPQFDVLQPTWTAGRDSETITMAFVICEKQFDIGMVAIKSAIAFSTSPLNLIITVDDENKSGLKEQSILPDVDALLYVSARVVFVHPVEDLWRMFYSMNDHQMVGMAPEKENTSSNVYRKGSPQPFVKPFGVNSDVLLMNLTRMRAFGFESRLARINERIKNVKLSRFQDALNILFALHPDGIFTFTCRWNYRVDHCYGRALCADFPAAAFHGHFDVFMTSKVEFMALHASMKEYELGESLVHGFINPLKKTLVRAEWNLCQVEMMRQLEYWRLSAHRVDMVANLTNPLREPA